MIRVRTKMIDSKANGEFYVVHMQSMFDDIFKSNLFQILYFLKFIEMISIER